jgi:hypothetical protein
VNDGDSNGLTNVVTCISRVSISPISHPSFPPTLVASKETRVSTSSISRRSDRVSSFRELQVEEMCGLEKDTGSCRSCWT